MRSLVCTKPGLFTYMDTAEPVPVAGHSIIKIKRIGICGTDIHAFEGTQPFFEYPRILGHELSGDMADLNGAIGFEQGEAVTFLPYQHCGVCIACRMNKPNCCSTMQVFGVHKDGGMTGYLSVPSSLLVHGQGLSYDELALVEPLAIAAHAVRRADVKPGEIALVTGAGPIGLAVTEFCQVQGAKVIVLDMNKSRLLFCQEQLGVFATINILEQPVAETIKRITGNDFPTVLFDATGNHKAIVKAFDYMAHGSRYILVGLQKEPVSFLHPEFHKREGTLMSSRNATRADFDYVISCIKNQLVRPLNYITHRAPFAEAKEKFDTWLDPEAGVIKAIIDHN